MLTFQLYTSTHQKIIIDMVAMFYDEVFGISRKESDTVKTLEHLAAFPEKGTVYVFMKDEIVVGYAIVINFWSNEFGGNLLEIDELFVQTAYRGRSIASDFFNYLSQQAEPDTVGLSLQVLPDNQHLQNFYEKLGFEVSANIMFCKML